MKATAITYSTLEVVQAKLLHGQACRHEFWAEILDLDPDADDFAVPAELVVARPRSGCPDQDEQP